MITQQSIIAAIIVKSLDVPAEKITREARFAEDLGADSLDVVDVAMQVEDAFKITIHDDHMMKMTTVGDLLDHVEKNARISEPELQAAS